MIQQRSSAYGLHTQAILQLEINYVLLRSSCHCQRKIKPDSQRKQMLQHGHWSRAGTGFSISSQKMQLEHTQSHSHAVSRASSQDVSSLTMCLTLRHVDEGIFSLLFMGFPSFFVFPVTRLGNVYFTLMRSLSSFFHFGETLYSNERLSRFRFLVIMSGNVLLHSLCEALIYFFWRYVTFFSIDRYFFGSRDRRLLHRHGLVCTLGCFIVNYLYQLLKS